MNHNDSHDAIKRTLEWVRYNVKGYLNLRWRLVTIDLRSKLCMCSVLDTVLTKNFAADLSLQTFNTRSLGKVWLEILVTNLTTYFHNLVAKVKNLVALVPVLGEFYALSLVHTVRYRSLFFLFHSAPVCFAPGP